MKKYKFFGGPKEGEVIEVANGVNQVQFVEYTPLTLQKRHLRLAWDSMLDDESRHIYIKERVAVGEMQVYFFRSVDERLADLMLRVFGCT